MENGNVIRQVMHVANTRTGIACTSRLTVELEHCLTKTIRIAACVTPVSYTHLDVYKRQVLLVLLASVIVYC